MIRNSLCSGLLIFVHLLYRIYSVDFRAREAATSAKGQKESNYETGNNSVKPKQGTGREEEGVEEGVSYQVKEKENSFLCVNKMSLHHFDLQILKKRSCGNENSCFTN